METARVYEISQVSRLAAEQLPDPFRVAVLAPDVAERNANRELPGEARVGQEDLASPVDRIHQASVQIIEPRRDVRLGLAARKIAGSIAQADRGERDRGQAFEIRVRVHPGGERGRHFEVMGDPASVSLQPEPAKHQPQLEGTETAPQDRGVLVDIADRSGPVQRAQVLRHERERGPQDIHSARQQQRRIKRCEEPLVGVDDDRVGALPAGEQATLLRQECHGPAVGGVDVQPQATRGGDVGDRRNRIDRGR